MGIYVAQCMVGVEEDYGLDSHLELFSHITRFFGYKVSRKSLSIRTFRDVNG